MHSPKVKVTERDIPGIIHSLEVEQEYLEDIAQQRGHEGVLENLPSAIRNVKRAIQHLKDFETMKVAKNEPA